MYQPNLVNQFLSSLASPTVTQDALIKFLSEPAHLSPLSIYNLPCILDQTACIPRGEYRYNVLVEALLKCCDAHRVRDMPYTEIVMSGLWYSSSLMPFLHALRQELQSPIIQSNMIAEQNEAHQQLQRVNGYAQQNQHLKPLHFSLYFYSGMNYYDVGERLARLMDSGNFNAEYLAKISYDFKHGFKVDLFLFVDAHCDCDYLYYRINDSWACGKREMGYAVLRSITKESDVFDRLHSLCFINKQSIEDEMFSLWMTRYESL